ncbi:MAG: MOSC domain-containing protein [Epsilonproteobacteria bacterium 4484_65]|nr:MAG: MOSC domain-containing protein [Epsilonproteobacteria bacterium 4484_65]
MTKIGNTFSLFYSPVSGRTLATELLLDEKGIDKDKHYNKNIDRSVLIASVESYTLAKNNDINAPYGALGENLLIDYNPYHLPSGSRLKIGDVTLEITQHCTLCKSLVKVDAKLPKLLKNDRGIFAKVIESGKIKEGDDIYLLG